MLADLGGVNMGESRVQGDGDRPADNLAYCTLLCPSLLYHLSPVIQATASQGDGAETSLCPASSIQAKGKVETTPTSGQPTAPNI